MLPSFVLLTVYEGAGGRLSCCVCLLIREPFPEIHQDGELPEKPGSSFVLLSFLFGFILERGGGTCPRAIRQGRARHFLAEPAACGRKTILHTHFLVKENGNGGRRQQEVLCDVQGQGRKRARKKYFGWGATLFGYGPLPSFPLLLFYSSLLLLFFFFTKYDFRLVSLLCLGCLPLARRIARSGSATVGRKAKKAGESARLEARKMCRRQ